MLWGFTAPLNSSLVPTDHTHPIGPVDQFSNSFNSLIIYVVLQFKIALSAFFHELL